MIVEHLVTKRVEKGKRRLFFRCHNDDQKPFGGKIEIDLLLLGKPIKKINAYSEPLQPGVYSVFYADVSTIVANSWGSFSWSWGKYAGTGEKSDKFEKVY